jgi:hypothetical protein
MTDHPLETSSLRSERSFLHDIASPISALQLNLDALQEECEEKKILPPDLALLLREAHASAERVMTLLRERRGELIAAGVPPSEKR